jgi:hypothetical protein
MRAAFEAQIGRRRAMSHRQLGEARMAVAARIVAPQAISR